MPKMIRLSGILTKRTRYSCAASCGVSALAIALSTAQPAQAQSCPGVGGGICETIVAENGQNILTQGATHIVNQAAGTSITQMSNDYLLVENQADATINSIALLPLSAPSSQFGPVGNTIVNAGTIAGDLIFANGGIYVDAGGSVTGQFKTRNGDVPLGQPEFTSGFTSEVFIDRAGGSNILDPGNGIDFFIQSYSLTSTESSPLVHSLTSALPANFEVGGVEALGSNVVVAIHNEVSGQGDNGLSLWGNGAIINRAIINNASAVGSGLPPEFAAPILLRAVSYAGEVGKTAAINFTDFDNSGQPFSVSLTYGGGLASFTNEGVINGDLLLHTADFVNSGAINLRSSELGTLISAAAGQDFRFSNSGSIVMTDTGPRQPPVTNAAITLSTAIDATTVNAVDLSNSGDITGGLAFHGFASDFVFDNSGTISRAGNPNGIHRAVDLTVGSLDLPIDRSEVPQEWLLGREDVAAETAAIINSGTIDGGISAELLAKRFSFLNIETGTILSDASDAFAEAVELSVEGYGDASGNADVTDAEFARFENRGAIVGKAEIEFEASEVEIVNSGTIKQNKIAPADLYAGRRAALELDVETSFASRVSFENSGEIFTADHAGVGVAISVLASEGAEDGVPGAENSTAVVNVVNSGTIHASGGNYITPGVYLGMPGNPLIIDFAAGLAVLADAEGGSSISIRNEAGGIISARGEAHLGTPGGKQSLADQEPTAGGIAIAAAAENVTIVNAGTILGSAGAASFTSPAGTFVPADAAMDLEGQLDFEDVLGGAIDTFRGNDVIINETTGVIEGGIALRSGDDSLSNYGTITGDIWMGSGADQLSNFGTIAGNVDLGDGDDSFIQSLLASFDGIADGGAGEDTLVFDITGATYTGTIDPVLRAKFIGFEIEKLIGTGSIISNEEQSVGENGELTLVAGTNINVGAGNTALAGSETGSEQVTIRPAAIVTGNIDMRGGDNIVANEGTVQGNILALDGDNRFTNASGGTVDGNVTFGNGVNIVDNQGTITGTVQLGNGGNSFTNAGSVEGGIAFGTGNDELVLVGDWAIGGGVYGGAGTDTVQAAFHGTNSAPQELDLSGFEEIEQFTVNGGTGALSGTATFGQIDVNDGYLFGRAGSTINSNVNVAPGATFGSAGTVNGDIEVAGTLSPGSSPGTLTVNGDVTLASSSVTHFEMTPTISDAIVINGSLTIDDGAMLNIEGERPLTPGVTYNLITASDGIEGQFVITKADTVLGFINQTDTALQLLGTFQLRAGATAQSSRTTDYLNSLLIAGTAPAGVVAAVPELLEVNGFVNETALATINPEAYGSAVQVGIENGLAISSALRSASFAGMREDGGLFSFGQGFGQWRNFAADRASGTAQANLRTSGVLGGIGFGNANFSISGFVGYVDARQELAGRGAVTNADGLFAGANLRARLGGFQAGGSVVWDRSSADTSRILFNGSKASDKYRLRGLTLDGFVGYSFDFSQDWQVGPQMGITHISVKRGDASETGGAVFALQVAGQRYDATFLSGDLVLTRSNESKWQPYLAIGVRHQLGGDAITVTGGFVGAPTGYTALGTERDETFGRVGAGFAVRLSPALSLFARGESEFGADNNAKSISGGLRLNF